MRGIHCSTGTRVISAVLVVSSVLFAVAGCATTPAAPSAPQNTAPATLAPSTTVQPTGGSNATSAPTDLDSFDAIIQAAGYAPNPSTISVTKTTNLSYTQHNGWSAWCSLASASCGFTSIAYVTCGGKAVLVEYGSSPTLGWTTAYYSGANSYPRGPFPTLQTCGS